MQQCMRSLKQAINAKIINVLATPAGKHLALVIPERRMKNYIQALSCKGNSAAAEALTKKIISNQTPESPAGQLIIAFNHQQAGRYKEALAACDMVIKYNNKSWDAYLIKGVCHNELNETRQAREAFAAAHKLHPQHIEIACHLLAANTKVNGIQSTIGIYQSMKAQIKVATLHDKMAQLLFQAGETDQLNKHLAEHQLPYQSLMLSSVHRWATQNQQEYTALGDAEIITSVPPPIFDANGISMPKQEFKTKSNKPYTATLENVTVFSRSSIIKTADNTALNDCATHPEFGEQVNLVYEKLLVTQRSDAVLVNISEYTQMECEAGIWLSGLASEAYGHWVPEYLTKLQMLTQHPEFSKMPIIVDEQMPQSHFDYLKALVSNELIKLPLKTALHCKKLLVCPTAVFYPVELRNNHTVPQHEIAPLSPRSLDYLRTQLQRSYPTTGKATRKIYLSRRNMQWRKITNDAEIAKYLESEGFETVYPEDLSFKEQLELFQQVDTIVAPNGSSTLNMIFAPTCAKLFMLSQPGTYNWGGFYGPMRSIGYNNIVFVVGDEPLSHKHLDYSIPVERIKAAIEWNFNTF